MAKWTFPFWSLVFLLLGGSLQAQTGLEDQFWYGLDPRVVAQQFPDDRARSAPAGGELLDEPIVILKRDTPFARIERTGEVLLLGSRKGWLLDVDGHIRVMRNGQELGSVDSEGIVRAPATVLGTADSYGYLYDAREEYRGSFSGESIWIDGWVWGSASPLTTPQQMRLVAAFMYFFTELPLVWAQ